MGMLSSEIVFVDGETRSFADLRLVGGANYAEDKTTESLVWVFTHGSDGVIWVPQKIRRMSHDVKDYLPKVAWADEITWTLFIGPEVPEIIASWRRRPWCGHNAHGFDRLVWNALYPQCRVETWVDSLKISKRAGLPGSLDGLGETLFGLGKHEGKSVLSSLCKPHHKTGAFLPLNRRNIRPLTAYCVQDVLLMRSAWYKTLRFYAEAADNAVMKACDIVNQYGALLDTKLANQIITLEVGLREKRGEHLEGLTDGLVTRAMLRSAQQLKKYFRETLGVILPNVQRGTLTELLDSEELAEQIIEKHPGDSERYLNLARLIIEARLGETKITSTKLVRALDGLTRDGRMKFILAYHAAHTGRWGGRRFQPQNLPRGKLSSEDIAYCIEILLCDELTLDDKIAAIDLVIPDKVTISEAIGSLVRACVVAPKGKMLAIADFSAIEARGLAWVAEDERSLDNFRKDLDPYKVFATDVFNAPYEDITKKQRTICKPPVLGAGYQIGGEKLEAYALGMGIDLAKHGWTGPALVEMWRDANPLVAGERNGEEYEGRPIRKGGLWRDFQYGAMDVVKTGREKIVGRCRLYMKGRHFHVRLPSGKEIVYRNAEVEWVENQWGGQTKCFTFDRPFGAKVVRASQYGGKWVENVVQALCTGCGGLTGAALERLVSLGLDVILHVHDELVSEVLSVKEFLIFMYVMNMLPDWAKGFPNKTCGFVGLRYTKDPGYHIIGDIESRGLKGFKEREVEILDDGFGNIEWRGVSAEELEWLQREGLTRPGADIARLIESERKSTYTLNH